MNRRMMNRRMLNVEVGLLRFYMLPFFGWMNCSGRRLDGGPKDQIRF